MLFDFVTAHREELIARTRAKVSMRSSPKPTEIELTKGVPLFLDQLAEALRVSAPPSAEATRTIMSGASVHGGELLKKGFTIAQVVHDFSDCIPNAQHAIIIQQSAIGVGLRELQRFHEDFLVISQ